MKRQDGYLTQKSGAWLGHYSRWVTDPRNGEKKRQQRSFKIGPVRTTTKTQARNKLRERIVSELGITADSRATLAWFIEHRWKPVYEGNWRESTKAVNGELLKFVIDRFGTTPIEDMDRVAMQRWLADLAKRKSASLVRHCYIFLRSILTEATEQDYCRKNPARLLQVPRQLKAVKKIYLTLPEIQALLEAATFQPRERALLRLILVTALRPSELFALKWKCLDMVNNTLTITETVYRGKIRPYTKTTEEGQAPRLAVPEDAVMALVEWHSQSKRNGDEDYIFPNEVGGFLLKENYSKRVLKELAKQAGIPKLNFQILRRTVATHAQHLGSLKDVQTILRHKQAETTSQHYIQAIEQTVRETGNLLAAKMLEQPKGNPMK
ncbi:MAG: site-specific integrase [Acidobacteriia bacterium]|nr:site-specific integrase [Terriglobia bacterium]